MGSKVTVLKVEELSGSKVLGFRGLGFLKFAAHFKVLGL